MNRPPIDAYTDGACSGNPGPGGWGAYLIQAGQTRELSGGEQTRCGAEAHAVRRAGGATYTLPLAARLYETLRDVAAAPLIDRKAWAGVFRAAAGLCHGEDAAAVPDIPDDMAKRLKDVARMQIRQLKVNHNFDLASYGLTYST